ncbi:hypothetical protein NKG05_07400 [Oerskovia sp. M15]
MAPRLYRAGTSRPEPQGAATSWCVTPSGRVAHRADRQPDGHDGRALDTRPHPIGRPTMTNLELLTDAHLTRARDGDNGRSAELVLHDGVLRQTIIAIVEGVELGEHNAPRPRASRSCADASG